MSGFLKLLRWSVITWLMTAAIGAIVLVVILLTIAISKAEAKPNPPFGVYSIKLSTTH